jgi:hypothetical protein
MRFLPVDVVSRSPVGGSGATFDVEVVREAGETIRVRAIFDTETLLALVRAKC